MDIEVMKHNISLQVIALFFSFKKTKKAPKMAAMMRSTKTILPVHI